ncbi:MAG: Major Facilitator Superfamily protein [Deltaproteobacteria bacterium ADurb.Bin510]|nr:MAG: Major Facilitator Superfamily protein [Deltaproteobacteria bacterium ADurb.Bin510]
MLFLLEKGLSFTLIGTLYAYREIMINVLEVPTGVIADACGRRRTMVQSFAAYIVAFLVFYYAASFWLLLLGMTAFAFGEAFRGGTHKAMIFEYLRINGWADQKVDYYGHTRAWSQRGSALSALLAAALVFVSGRYDIVFMVSTLPYLLNLGLMLSYPEELDGEIRRGNASLKDSFQSVWQSLKQSLIGAGKLRATTNVCLYDGFYNAAKDFLQPIVKALALSLPVLASLQERQRSAVLVGLVYFMIYLLTSRASAAAGRFAERFDSLPQPLNLTMLLGFGLGAFCGLTHYCGRDTAAIIGFMGIFMIQNLRSPLSVSYVSETVPDQILATSLSVRSLVTALYTAVMAFILGVLADWLGLGTALMVLSLGLIGLTPLYRLKPVPRS